MKEQIESDQYKGKKVIQNFGLYERNVYEGQKW